MVIIPPMRITRKKLLFAGFWLLAAANAVMHWKVAVWAMWVAGILAMLAGVFVLIFYAVIDGPGSWRGYGPYYGKGRMRDDEVDSIEAGRFDEYAGKRRRKRRIEELERKAKKERRERVEKRRSGFYHEVHEEHKEKV